MSNRRVRTQVKTQLDAAIAAGTQPKAPRSGIGLVLPTGTRFRTLYDKKGLTPAGRYYYDQSGIAPPGSFDFQQDAVRKKGRSQYIKLLDGTQKKVSMWDSVGKEWKLTALGKTFFQKMKDYQTKTLN